MDHFHYVNGIATCEEVPLPRIAEAVGTPAYIYSAATLRRHCRRFAQAFSRYDALPCFAVKANSNLSVLAEIFASGFGADIVSVGELERALLSGAKPKEIVFSGVGKREDEIRRGLEAGILSFNVESEAELSLVARIAAERSDVAPVSLRVNPNIDAKTNPKIATGLHSTKFGIPEDVALQLIDKVGASPALKLVGLACHIGSQITDLTPLKEAAQRMVGLAQGAQQRGHELKLINMGGGLGIRYRSETPPELEDYAETLIREVKPTGLRLLVEPGRVVAGNSGILLSRVLGLKQTPAKTFVVCDAAMNDLTRPTLYDSYHEILPVREAAAPDESASPVCDYVGPICETGDILGQDRPCPTLEAGEFIYVRGCGAYAAAMASQYNSRPRAPEVLVDGDEFFVIRPRETLESLWAGEKAALRPKTPRGSR